MTTKKENYFKKIKKNKQIVYYSNNVNLGKKVYIHFLNENTDKPKYFVIENIEFLNGLYIKTDENIYITFKNCTFHKNVSINSLGDISFEGNKYLSDADYPIYPTYFFTVKAKNLRLTNELFFNSGFSRFNFQNIFGLNIDTKSLVIDESLIRIKEENGNVIIKSDETIIFNSVIESQNTNIKSNTTYVCNSRIEADESVSIESTNLEEIEIDCIESPLIMYNGEKVEKAKVFSL